MKLTTPETILFTIFIAVIYFAGFGFGYLTGWFARKDREENKNM